MSPVHRSQQLFLADEKLPQLLTGVLQAIVWATPQGCAGGQSPCRCPGDSWPGCRTPGAVPAWGCVSAHQQLASSLCGGPSVPRPGQAPFLCLGARLGEHFAFKVGVAAAHPAQVRVRGAGIPAPCWGPVANHSSPAQRHVPRSPLILKLGLEQRRSKPQLVHRLYVQAVPALAAGVGRAWGETQYRSGLDFQKRKEAR